MDILEVLEKLSVDKNRIQQTFSGNMNLYKRFLVKFPDDKTYISLCEAVEKNDLHGIEIAAHTLKGIAGNLGLENIFNINADIMACAKSGDEAGISSLMEQLKEEYDCIIPYIKMIS